MQKNFSQYLLQTIPSIVSYTLIKGELCLTVPVNKILPLVTFLKYHTNCQYKVLSDLCVVDYPTRLNRFELVYHFLSLQYNTRLRIKILFNELESVSSITSVFRGANWWEREAWDMFGVFFTDHPDLRRILTDYGFEGYPLRKDFPLSGFTEVRYSELKKRVIYEPLNLPQEFKSFQFENPWKG